MLSFVKSNL